MNSRQQGENFSPEVLGQGDLARDAELAHDAVPGLIVANWVEGRLR